MLYNLQQMAIKMSYKSQYLQEVDSLLLHLWLWVLFLYSWNLSAAADVKLVWRMIWKEVLDGGERRNAPFFLRLCFSHNDYKADEKSLLFCATVAVAFDVLTTVERTPGLIAPRFALLSCGMHRKAVWALGRRWRGLSMKQFDWNSMTD